MPDSLRQQIIKDVNILLGNKECKRIAIELAAHVDAWPTLGIVLGLT